MLMVIVVIAVAAAIWGGAQLRHRYLVSTYKAECRQRSDSRSWGALKLAADKLLRVDSTSVDGWLFRAEAAEAEQDWEQFCKCLGQVPLSDVRIIPSLLRKMQTEFGPLNRPFEGLQTCDAILKIDNRVLLAHKQGIFFCAMTLQRSELVRRVRQAIRTGRESPESYVFLASVSWQTNSSAYTHATTWLKSNPENEILTVAQALPVYNSEAKSDLEHATTFQHVATAEDLFVKFPGNPELTAFFLDRAISDGDVERVRALLAGLSAGTLQTDARFLRAQAWVHDVDGHLDMAEQSLKAALVVDPYWWQLHHQLQDVFRRLNRPVEATEALKRYKAAIELAVCVRGLKRYEQSFEDPRFSQLMLTMAELTDDMEVLQAIRSRLAN